MSKAAQLAARLESLSGEAGIALIEAQAEKALAVDVLDDVMCLMHTDGSANIVEIMSGEGVKVEVISASNILRVLRTYRPFKDVFKDQIQ